MGRLALATLAIVVTLPLTWIPNVPSAGEAYTFTGLLLAFGVLLSIWMIRTLRARRYVEWRWPARWAFLGLAGGLAALYPVVMLLSLFDPQPAVTPAEPGTSATLVGWVVGKILYALTH